MSTVVRTVLATVNIERANGTATSVDNTIIYENSNDLSLYTTHVIHNMGGAQDIDVDVSVDGGTSWCTQVPLEDIRTGNALANDEIPDNTIGVLRLRITDMRVRNKGGTTSADCVVLHY